MRPPSHQRAEEGRQEEWRGSADGPAATATDSADPGIMGTRVIHPGININVAARRHINAAPNWRGCLMHEPQTERAELSSLHIYDSRVCTWLFIYDGCLRTSAGLFYLKHLTLNNEAAGNYSCRSTSAWLSDMDRKMAAPSDVNLRTTFSQRHCSFIL